jgi:hypothetical protein
VQPPAKRRHGWDPTPSGGTDTPILPSGNRVTWSDEDFPVLDGEIDVKTPTPAAGVIKSLKADARKAQAAHGKGKGKAKNKSGSKGKTVHIEQADELLDALVAQARQGTSSTGAESGSLGDLGASGSAIDGHLASAIGHQSGVQEAAAGAQTEEAARTSSAASSSSGVHGAAQLAPMEVQDTTGMGAAIGATSSATTDAGAGASAAADVTPGANAEAGAGAPTVETVPSVAGASAPQVGPTGTGTEVGDPKGTKQPIPSTTPGNSGEQGAGSAETGGSSGAAGRPTDSGSLNQ